MYTIDAKSNERYFVVYLDENEIFKVAKSTNSLEKVINMIGRENIKEVIE